MPELLKRLGRYEILEELGRGGMGVVYRAKDEQLRRTVAIKILRPGLDQAARARFIREARAVATLRHPHIVPIYDVGEENNQPYFVMEFVDGLSLAEAVDRESITRRQAVTVLLEAAEAIAFAHRSGILHRDLKPDNIRVQTRDSKFDTPHAVVMDFGLAKISALNETTVSFSGVALGTPCFMSPEQARGEIHSIDVTSDVWGLGATLYAVLTGMPPFRGATLPITLHQVLNADPIPPRQIDPTIELDLQTICLKALEKNPQRRYPTADAFAQDLRHSLAGEPISARPPNLIYRVRRWIRRRAALLSVASITLVLVSSGAYALTLHSRTRAFRDAQSKAQRAFEEKDWRQALFEADRATAIFKDPSLTTLAAECRTHLAQEASLRDLMALLNPIDQEIRDIRLLLYIKGAKVEPRLRSLEEALLRVEGQLANPSYAHRIEGWRALGLGWYFVGDTDRALAALAQAEKRDPNDGWVNYTLGRIHMEHAWLNVLAARPNTPPLQAHANMKESADLAMAHLDRLTHWDGATEMQRHQAATYRSMAAGDDEDVLRRCQEGILRYGEEMGTEDYWVLKAVVLPQERMTCLKKAIEIRPHFAWAYFYLCYVMLDRNAALEGYTKAIALQPRFVEAHYNRGVLHQRGGELDKALADYTETIRLKPTFVSAFYNRGNVHGDKGNYIEAIKDFSEVIRLDPTRADAYHSRGVAYKLHGDLDSALQDHTHAIQIDPSLIHAYVSRAIIYNVQGRYDLALEDTNHAQAIDPTFPNTYAVRGEARSRLGDIDGALSDFSEAIRADPTNADAYADRAKARLEKGDRSGVAEDCRRALQLAPPNWPYRADVERRLRDASSP